MIRLQGIFFARRVPEGSAQKLTRGRWGEAKRPSSVT